MRMATFNLLEMLFRFNIYGLGPGIAGRSFYREGSRDRIAGPHTSQLYNLAGRDWIFYPPYGLLILYDQGLPVILLSLPFLLAFASRLPQSLDPDADSPFQLHPPRPPDQTR